MEAARRRPRLALFLAALGLRLACLAAVSWASGIRPPDLALFFDGHVYILIAKSLPRLYGDVHAFFPAFPKSVSYLTAWFPVYPALIAAVGPMLGDLRWAALAVSQAAAAAAVVLFYELARRFTRRPLAAAGLFLALPPIWLLCGSLAFVEPVYVCLFIATMLCHLSGKRAWAMALAGLVLVTQKSGFLILPIMLLTDPGLRQAPRWRALLPYAAALAPVALLQAYLWSLYGDPLVNVHAQQRVFGGTFFGWPGRAFAASLLDPGQPFRGLLGLRKLTITASLLFYAGALAVSWPRRTSRTFPLMVWLGVVLAFTLCLASANAFYVFPRYMLMAAPAAMLLWADRLERLPGPAGLAVLAALALAFNAAEALSQLDLASRYWTPPYFWQLKLIL